MNPMLQEALGSIIRAGLLAAAGFFVKQGLWTEENAAAYATALTLAVLGLGWSLWQKYKSRLTLLAMSRLPQGATENEAKVLAKVDPSPVSLPQDQAPPAAPDTTVQSVKRSLLILLIGTMLVAPACGGARQAPVFVAQGGVVAAKTVGSLSDTIDQLTTPRGPISKEIALQAQERLLQVNNGLKKLVPILRSIDAAQQAGNPELSQLEQALKLLEAVSSDLSLVVAGIPVSSSTADILKAVQEGQKAITTVLAEVARIQGVIRGSSKYEPTTLAPLVEAL
jgi:hypothetical protein